MKKHILLVACISTIVASCNRVEIDEVSSRLEINVKTASVTKTIVEGSTLPSGSSIGLFLFDKSINSTYEGNLYQNIKYTATGEGESQKWSTDTDIMLSGLNASLIAYYPYRNLDIEPLIIEAPSQVDWMYATPIENVNNKNNNVTLQMHHALAAVRINIASSSDNISRSISKVKLYTRGIASKANFFPIEGQNLTNIQGVGEPYVHEETLSLNDGPKTIDFIAIPTGYEDIVMFDIIIEGKDYLGSTDMPVLIEAGKLYELNVIVNATEQIQLNSINVKNWEVEINNEAEELEAEEFIPWARIQHIDGTLYTADEWRAAEEAGIVIDDQANGVAVRYSRFASCPHVIHPETFHFRKWSSSYSLIPNVYTNVNKGAARLDVDGRSNTDDILSFVSEQVYYYDADPASYCNDLIFANGQHGYLPAAGELQAWYDNYNEIQNCLIAITDATNLLGALSQNGSSAIWSSTQTNAYEAWSLNLQEGLVSERKETNRMVRAVTSFTYNP